MLHFKARICVVRQGAVTMMLLYCDHVPVLLHSLWYLVRQMLHGTGPRKGEVTLNPRSTCRRDFISPYQVLPFFSDWA